MNKFVIVKLPMWVINQWFGYGYREVSTRALEVTSNACVAAREQIEKPGAMGCMYEKDGTLVLEYHPPGEVVADKEPKPLPSVRDFARGDHTKGLDSSTIWRVNTYSRALERIEKLENAAECTDCMHCEQHDRNPEFPCEKCRGTGNRLGSICSVCNGSGHDREKERREKR